MDPVEVVVLWDDWSPEERLAGLSDVVNSTLAEWGYDEVDTDRDAVGDSSYYDRENDTVAFGDDMLAGDDPFDALSSAYHETGHAMRDQDGGSELLAPDDIVDWNEKSFDFVPDDEDPSGFSTPSNVNPFHDDVNDFSGYMMDQTLGQAAAAGAGPAGSPVPTAGAGSESAADSDAPSSSDVEFEIDFDNVTVTSEPSDPVSFDADFSAAVVSS